MLMLGEIALERREWKTAKQSIRRALLLEPRNALAHFTLGRAFHLAGEIDAAAESYRRAVELMPDFALAHCNLGIVLFDLGENEAAWQSALAAAQRDPTLADAHMTIGRAALELHRFELAEPALNRAIAIDPGLPDAHDALGRLKQRLGHCEEATRHHRAALALDPERAAAWHGIGIAERAMGRFEQAAVSFRRALDIAPDFGGAHRDLALCQRAAANEDELRRMQEIAGDPKLGPGPRAHAAAGLGKFFDDIGDYDAAFRHYHQANRTSREAAAADGLEFEIEAVRREVDEAIATFTPEFFAARHDWGIATDLPVFVVGLYRSGTTLTEQILASHPNVFGAGELPDIRAINHSLSCRPSDALGWKKDDVLARAAAHLARLIALGGGAGRCVDKHPDNIFLVGLIATLFPGAKIICCHRDPRDNVLSCFFQQFSRAMTFATDLADCARRWRETERIAAHWRRVLPGQMLDLQYETLVEDFETEARRLIDFIGLAWDPACLDFFNTERSVNTPSTWQVRQPIYRSSAGRWRNYEAHIGPLLAALNEPAPGSG